MGCLREPSVLGVSWPRSCSTVELIREARLGRIGGLSSEEPLQGVKQVTPRSDLYGRGFTRVANLLTG